MKITFVTGNFKKIAQAKQFLEPLGIEVNSIKMNPVKIQANSVEEVASYSVKYLSEELKTNVIKSETGLMVEALNGFPSAYTNYASDTIGENGLLKLMKDVENRNACFIQALAFCEYGKESVVFKSFTEGTISKRKSGKYGWGWDYIFIPKGETKTLGSFKDEKRIKLFKDSGFKQLVEYLKNNNLIN